MAGRNRSETTEILDVIVQLRSECIAILLIESNLETVIQICDRIVVPDHGGTIADGLPEGGGA